MKILINKVNKIALVVMPILALSATLSGTAQAHDPSLHVKKAEKADCSKMEHSNMDSKDPVAMAMMKKCMKQAKKDMTHGSMDHSKMEHDAKKHAEKDNSHDH